MTFEQLFDTRLYTAAGSDAGGEANTGHDRGWVGFLLPAAGGAPSSIALAEALSSRTLAGSFVFAAVAPDFDRDAVERLVAALDALIGSGRRVMTWLSDPARISHATASLMPIAFDGTSAGGLEAPILGNGVLGLGVANGVKLALAADTLVLTAPSQTAAAELTGTSKPNATAPAVAELDFAGPRRGCIRFTTSITRASLAGQLSWGFQYLAPTPPGGPLKLPAIGQWLPLASGLEPAAADRLEFAVSIDPADPFNAADPDAIRSALAFLGVNRDGSATVLSSCFTTTGGAAITLLPVPANPAADPHAARLVLALGVPQAAAPAQFQAAPAGDFELALEGAPPGRRYRLLCGLQGTESISFAPGAGDRLRFVPGCAAYAPTYPLPTASPVQAPVDPAAPLLDRTYRTSWATFVAAGTDSGGYVGQPAGFALYGPDALIAPSHPMLYGAQEFPLAVSSAAFPLAPYAAVEPGDGVTAFAADTIEAFEREILAATRRPLAARPAAPRTQRRPGAAAAAGADADAAPYNATTPMGLLVAADPPTGAYERLLLARDRSGGELLLSELHPTLQQAFQTGQLFLVIANANRLGAPLGPPPGSFANSVQIGGWKLTADVGAGQYGDYTNVIIVKGRPGPLYDPPASGPDPSLLASPGRWTLAGDFAAPSHGNQGTQPVFPEEIAVLSAWLQNYFKAAAAQPDSRYFENFNRIAKLESWTGILILRMAIKPPGDLAGLAAGVADPTRFYAHHLGIEVSPVKNPGASGTGEVQLSDASSMFGLIHYEDPELTPPPLGQAPAPVPPQTGASYDFRLLTLKALFADSAVVSFESYAQLTLNSLFQMPVASMSGAGANPLNTLVLSGAYQENGGTPVYSLTASGDSIFAFQSNALERVELLGARMTTVSAGDPTVSRFELDGFLDFGVAAGPKRAFDVFSFGNAAGAREPRQGLACAGLAVQMSFPAGAPADKVMTFQTDTVRFDPARSTGRAGSLYRDFALALQDLVSGASDAAPSGYLPVIGDAVFTGVQDKPWYGLRYQLDMGTPGALAGAVGLTATLIVAWTPTSAGSDGYEAFLGLELPGTGAGASLISLQSVLKLSIGQLRLTVVPEGSFLLMLTEIALRFLGVVKIPPSGSTSFYLFANPAGTDKPSGLGWYAMYDNEPETPPRTLAPGQSAAGEVQQR